MSSRLTNRILDGLKRALDKSDGATTPARARSGRPSLVHIEDALLELKERERLVLALRYYEKLTESDVASALRMKVSEIRRIQSEALENVVRHLACASRG